MSWAKLDDRYDDHPKMKRAYRLQRGTVGLHAMAITYCARHELDGVVDVEWIKDKLPAAKERERVLGALVDCGLFEPVDAEHYRVHDYLDYNPSRAQLEARRRADSERKAKGRGAASGGSPPGIQAESSCPIPSHPVPALEPPNPRKRGNDDEPVPVGDVAPRKPVSKRQRDQAAYDVAITAWAAHHFPGADPRSIEGTIHWARLSDPVTADALRAAVEANPVWAAHLGLSQVSSTTEEAAA